MNGILYVNHFILHQEYILSVTISVRRGDENIKQNVLYDEVYSTVQVLTNGLAWNYASCQLRLVGCKYLLKECVIYGSVDIGTLEWRNNVYGHEGLLQLGLANVLLL
ncbi:hypothetical protein K501DRAFT_271715 [Backusella circina FSU 941]|nr:hypothetical protein K501DRAFT_271715 [Backusella circina FSU 941]